MNTKYSTGVTELVAAYGPKEAARLAEAKANTTDTIAFDRVSRLVKIVPNVTEWTSYDPSRNGYSDGFILKEFGHETSAIWGGPKGTRISGVRFVDDELIVSVYGSLHLGESTRIVPREAPEDYIVPWERGSQPLAGSLYDAVLARHQNGG